MSQAAGGICTKDARGCGCLAITVTSLNETGLPEADVPTPGGSAPSLWSGRFLETVDPACLELCIDSY